MAIVNDADPVPVLEPVPSQSYAEMGSLEAVRSTLQLLRRYLGSYDRRLLVMGALTTCSAFAQVFALVIVASCGVAIASGADDASVPLVVTIVPIPVLPALGIAVFSAVTMGVLQITSAWVASNLVVRVQMEGAAISSSCSPRTSPRPLWASSISTT
jgi:hypothetical protein